MVLEDALMFAMLCFAIGFVVGVGLTEMYNRRHQ